MEVIGQSGNPQPISSLYISIVCLLRDTGQTGLEMDTCAFRRKVKETFSKICIGLMTHVFTTSRFCPDKLVALSP